MTAHKQQAHLFHIKSRYKCPVT